MNKRFSGFGNKAVIFPAVLIFVLASCVTTGGTGEEGQMNGEKSETSLSPSVLFDTKWMLTEILGRPLDEYGDLVKEPFLVFDGKEMRINGNAGCNNLMASFTLEGENRIYFSPIASTLMACPNMEVEETFKELLETVDTYIISGNELVLTRARMAPLLRFVDSRVYQMDAGKMQMEPRWAGLYTGVVPCADCEGIETELRIRENGTYTLRQLYRGRSSEVFSSAGSVSQDREKNILTLTSENSSDGVYYLLPGDFSMTILDRQGRQIEGQLASNYVLRKEIPPVLETYWKLTELYGESVTWSGEGSREPHMILRSLDNRVNGSAGCNSFSGTYTLDAGDLRFSQMAATQMACIDMETERLFFRALGEAQSYEAQNGRLSLFNGKSDVVARFEAVYLR